jgi:hypothetical protein
MVRGREVIIEPTARSTSENIERSMPSLESAPRIAVVTDWFHARVAKRYLVEIRQDLASVFPDPAANGGEDRGSRLAAPFTPRSTSRVASSAPRHAVCERTPQRL